MRRFESGQSVWISPVTCGQQLIEDEATIMDDLGDGYIVLQHTEREDSCGMGHFVQDIEVLAI